MDIKSLRGMNDILAPEIYLWHKVESVIRDVTRRFGYYEMRTPLLESTLLFKRGVGEGSDMVQKEMYSFEDKSGENISLRPEGTASVVRAVVEHNLLRENPVSKIYYLGEMFRHERPQKGRFRQFSQFGIELFGVAEAAADVEVIALAEVLLREVGLAENVQLHITSIGCNSSDCRPKYQKMLTSELLKYEKDLPEDFRSRIHTNPLRIFDQKDEKSKAIAAKLPRFTKEHLCTECRQHIGEVETGLSNVGIKYIYDEAIVRGIDYYNRTAFEFVTQDLGTQGTVCGGGRYDGLVKAFGGPDSPGIGFGLGMERLVMMLSQKIKIDEPRCELFLAYADENGKEFCLKTAHELRKQGFSVGVELTGKSVKAQLKYADKLKAQFCTVIGSNELANLGKIKVNDMRETKWQELTDSSEFPLIKSLLRGEKK